MFWEITPFSLFKANRNFGGACRLHFHLQVANRWLCLSPAFTLVFCLAYSPTLKMEVTFLSETSVHRQRTTRRYITDDINPHNHRCHNVKSHMTKICQPNFLTFLYGKNMLFLTTLKFSGSFRFTRLNKLRNKMTYQFSPHMADLNDESTVYNRYISYVSFYTLCLLGQYATRRKVTG
jgi:hypothetical protein